MIRKIGKALGRIANPFLLSQGVGPSSVCSARGHKLAVGAQVGCLTSVIASFLPCRMEIPAFPTF